ncbi:MAG: hypothetical protein KAT85_06565 [candidate division Zixibacteria bacterium]|nr:hypothetical protein [candidate division Zixibacteria bacterium]
MMNRSLLSLITCVAAASIPRVAVADTDLGGSTMAGSLVVGMIILVVVICIFLALKIFSLLKGGELASAWQLLTIAFVVLLIAEGVQLIDMLNIASLGDTAAMLIRLVGIGAVMIGMLRIKRVLS